MVKALVYIAAMASDEGETVGELLHRATPHASAPALVPDEDGFLWMSAKGFADAVSPESSADDALLTRANDQTGMEKKSLLGFWWRNAIA